MKPVYLDYNATTPVAQEVLEAMLPFLGEHFGNPSSAHSLGRTAAAAVGQAREEVAALINANAGEIVFTGCATEANNLAVLGVARAAKPGRRALVVSAIEHPAVMAPAQALAREGWRLAIAPVDGEGIVEIAALQEALSDDFALLSVMHANNEIGSIQPVAEIARQAHACGALMHCDAAQSAGKIAIDVGALEVDLLTLAGHKFYAPKGVGALYVKHGTSLQAVNHGASQEHGLRPGTENVAGIVGLGAAAKLARERMAAAGARLARLRDRLHERLRIAIPGLMLNGHAEKRLPNTLNVSFPEVSGRALLELASDDVAASLGAACHSEHEAVSGALAAIGADTLRAMGAVRLSVGWMTSDNDIDRAAAALIAAWGELNGRA